MFTRSIFVGSYYAVLYDETTNNKSEKELQLQIRYWSLLKKHIVSIHLRTFYLRKAKSTDLFDKILLALAEFNLPKDSIIMLGSDGPYVNQKVERLLDSHLVDVRGKGLLQIGSCAIHTCHNAYLKGNLNFLLICCFLLKETLRLF